MGGKRRRDGGGKREDKGIDSLHLSSILKKSQADLYAVSLGISSLCQVDIGSTRHPSILLLLWKKFVPVEILHKTLYIYLLTFESSSGYEWPSIPPRQFGEL